MKKTLTSGLAALILATGCASKQPVSHHSQHINYSNPACETYVPRVNLLDNTGTIVGTEYDACRSTHNRVETSGAEPICQPKPNVCPTTNYQSTTNHQRASSCPQGYLTVHRPVQAITPQGRTTTVTQRECAPQGNVIIQQHPGYGQGFQQQYGPRGFEVEFSRTKIQHTTHPHYQPRPQPRRRGR